MPIIHSNWRTQPKWSKLSVVAVLLSLLAIHVPAALAQTAGAASAPANDAAASAAPPQRSIIRFVTADDFPPFHYLDEEGVLTGFNIDVARAICLEVDVACDIATRNWEALMPTLSRGDADALIASMAITTEALKVADFTDRYYHTPARFVARLDLEKLDPTPEGLESRKIGVIRATAHEAYLISFFRDSIIQPYDTADALRTALLNKEVELAFGDGISLMFWLNGTQAQSCCEFRGGPFADPRFFGDGIGIAVRKGDAALKRQIDKALASLRKNGRLEDLFLRYFPLKIN